MLMRWQDFFYVCPGHLKERSFCTPVIDEAEAEAKRKKEAMDREIELIKQEYEDKMKKKKSKSKDKNAKDEDKGKEKAKDEEGKDDDDEKAKKEKDDKVVYAYVLCVISVAEFSPRSRLSQIKRHHQQLPMTYHGSTRFRSTLALCFNVVKDQPFRAFDLT